LALERPSPEGASFRLLDFVMEHSKKLWNSYRYLEEMMELYLKNRTNKRIKELAEEIKKVEKEGNDVKLRIFDYLARVGEALMYREDWMRLILNLDGLLDYVDSISYRLSIAASKKWYLTPEVAEEFRKLLLLINMMFDKLKQALSLLSTDALKVLELCNELEDLEGEVDERHRELNLVLLESNISFSAFMVLYEVLERLETLADLAVKTGDNLRLIAMHRAP
jgi:predicted phosphate transport protein (TIGR00153 family)